MREFLKDKIRPAEVNTVVIKEYRLKVIVTNKVLAMLFMLTQNPYRNYHKVNRCLARYSPRATTINQPTNRAPSPNEPARPGSK